MNGPYRSAPDAGATSGVRDAGIVGDVIDQFADRSPPIHRWCTRARPSRIARRDGDRRHPMNGTAADWARAGGHLDAARLAQL